MSIKLLESQTLKNKYNLTDKDGEEGYFKLKELMRKVLSQASVGIVGS